YAQGGDRRDVVLQRRQAAEVRALPDATEQGAHDGHEQDREDEREDGALRVAPERQLLVPDLVDHQAQAVTTARAPASERGSGHRGLLSGAPDGAPSRVSRR